jgi:LPPG:FO 2-phospho-L-lactate transferase
VLRTRCLHNGMTLTDFTMSMASQLGIEAKVLPMSNDPVRTTVVTSSGPLSFQDYFVRLKCAPVVRQLQFDNAESSQPSKAALAALLDPELAAVIICPSNPYLSIDPILALSEFRLLLSEIRAPIIAVSPLIGGRAVKGPTAKIMSEIGLAADNKAIAEHYPFLSGLIVDQADRSDVSSLDLSVHVTSTWMNSMGDRVRLASECLMFADRLAAKSEGRI